VNLTDLVTLIGNALTQLDTALTGSDLLNQPAKWQQLYALRKHLDDEQRSLVQSDIESDDVEFQGLANLISTATKQLTQQINDMTKIDSIINIVSQIAADVDSVLQLV
jgi:high-affinity Fe2+/Pb2+ permease